MTETEILTANTGAKVFIASHVKFVDAMGDLQMTGTCKEETVAGNGREPDPDRKLGRGLGGPVKNLRSSED
ncbi:MAG: hypothetical protein ACLTW9_04340 [Enterocloster sp.]